MGLEMFGQLLDFLGQDSNLNLRRASVRRMDFKLSNDFFFCFFVEHKLVAIFREKRSRGLGMLFRFSQKAVLIN